MGIGDARALGARVLDRIKRLPLYAFLAAGTLALAAAVVLIVGGMTGPTYSALFDGLSAARGGAVIAALQKEGIPYRLSGSGSVIYVPSRDLGRARLELGAQGEPGNSGSGWKLLEAATMTTSETATRALRMRAMEGSLEASLKALSGARNVQVMLALPKETPFLSDQPKPKASVILTGASEPDAALGLAVAKVVAGAVAGLKERDVVVATTHGHVIYPVSRTESADQQLRIESRIEAGQAAKIRAMLAPVLGAGNFRVTVSADVAFASQKIDATTYGPKSYPVSVSTATSKKIGNNNVPMGIPGALSNLPPGPTAAPLQGSGKGGAAAGGSTGKGVSAKTGGKGVPSAKQALPRSETKKAATHYAVDETSTSTVPALWKVSRINASVVVNKAALGKLTPRALQSMVASTIVIPGGSVNVSAAPFVRSSSVAPGGLPPRLAAAIHAGLSILAAFAMLFGVAIPSVRWLRRLQIEPAEIVMQPAAPSFEEDALSANLRMVSDQVAEVSQSRPDVMARVLQKWVQAERSE